MDTYSNITNPVDKEKVNDLLFTEKYLTDSYNTFSNEASTKALQQDLVAILNDEHELEFKIFEEMKKRGWYSLEQASQQEIDKVKQSYKKMS